MATAILKNIFHLGNCLLLVVPFYLTGCYYGEDGPCSGAYRLKFFSSNSFIDFYSQEPSLRYLRTTRNGTIDTLHFQTRLDTLYLGWSYVKGYSGLLACDRCSDVFEVIQVQFLNDADSLEMNISFSDCPRGEAHVHGKDYVVYPSSGYLREGSSDSLLMNDSLGFYYYVRDSQYRLTLLP